MSALGPNDVVVCVDVAHRGEWPASPIKFVKLGGVYRIKLVGECRGTPAVQLIGDPNNAVSGYERHGYHADRFRKLNDGTDDAELIERIRKCKPVRESQPA